MGKGGWNHNVQYYDLVLRAAPSPCRLALDVGCGRGELAELLASRCEQVIGVDMDAATLAAAGKSALSNVTFQCGDVMSEEFPEGRFDLITAVAALHHLPLFPALERFRDLLAPGGTLVVIGLYRAKTVGDFAMLPVSFAASRIFRWVYGLAKVGAPTREPEATLGEIRKAANERMPGVVVRRRLFFRYSLVWRKPGALYD